MRLSEKTTKILQNFTSINQSLHFKEGNTLRTISVMKNVLAEAEIDEYIPREFAIYDLPQFLNTLSLTNAASIDVTTDHSHALIRGNASNKTKFFFCHPSVIVAPATIAKITPQLWPELSNTFVKSTISATKPVALELTER